VRDAEVVLGLLRSCPDLIEIDVEDLGALDRLLDAEVRRSRLAHTIWIVAHGQGGSDELKLAHNILRWERGHPFAIFLTEILGLCGSTGRRAEAFVREIARNFVLEPQATIDDATKEDLRRRAQDFSAGRTLSIPLIGSIAAGTPIESLGYSERRVSVPSGALGPHEYFAMRAQGESMIEAGIHDGDIIVARRTDTASSGDIVIALIESEATLKRYNFRDGWVALEAANRGYEHRIFPADQVDIIGVFVTVLDREKN